VDGIELHCNLGLGAAAEAAASGKRGGGARESGAAEKISARYVHQIRSFIVLTGMFLFNVNDIGLSDFLSNS
jgi:hypothetical protein